MAHRFCEFLKRMHMLDRHPVFSRKKKVYKKRFNPFLELSEKDFRSIYRFSKINMQKLIAIVKKDLDGDRRGGRIPVELQVMAAIRCWGHNESQGDAAHTHGFSQPTISIICSRVARAFASKRNQYICMPRTKLEQKTIIDKFNAINGFPQVIGSIGCTHIRIKKRGGENSQEYINKKGYCSIIVQAVCDPDLRIRDIVCHLRGSTPASLVYDESIIKDRFSKGGFAGRLLGDSKYACSNWLFTPVPFNANLADVNYNLAHSATCMDIQQTFKALKSRFKILITGMRGSLDNIKITVEALCVLHNLAVECNDVMDDEEDCDGIDDDSNNDASSISVANKQDKFEDETSRLAFISSYFKKTNFK